MCLVKGDGAGILRLDFEPWTPADILSLGKLLAFGANSTLAGLKEGFDSNPTFAAPVVRAPDADGERFTIEMRIDRS